ncbi:DUF262 domain-containing protein [Citromicrobium bathyomarinum]|uniref:DUF262 domain-containing protein n=1 Tax=Citromicrobium bathyomarinum TaxID=72174 RepID=UPI00315A6E61
MTDDTLHDSELSDDLEDLEHVENWADGAVLWSTDWTSETVLSQLSRGNIDLNPSFQRRSAWSDKKQSFFIESLILGLPIPQLILAEDPSRKGAYIVIDGKQRLLAIRRFASVDNGAGFKPLKLKGLSERGDLNRKSYEDLKGDLAHDQDVAAFENSTIRTVVIRNWKQEAYLWEVFLRINTGSVQLSPQELRQALHPGPFSNFVDQYSGDSEGLRDALNLKSPDFRMRDAEILLRYISYRNFAEDYSGNLKQFLDETTRKFNENWEVSEDKVRNQMAEMEAAFAFTQKVFGKSDYLRKWNGEQFESRKNRAVFDIMLHWFSNDELRASLEGKEAEVVQAFKDLCESDPNFLAAIERTTKTTEANDWRFNKWADALSKISGVQLAPLDFGA